MFNFKKKNIIFNLSLVMLSPIILTSCNSVNNSIEDELLDLEIKNDVLLIQKEYSNLEQINLLNLANENYLLENIFTLPPSRTEIRDSSEYKIWYSWNFFEKNIVSFKENGTIVFDVDVNCGLASSQYFKTKSKQFEILIEETMIYEENNQNTFTNIPNTKALRYHYNDIKFQSIRKDVFSKSVSFNLDFFSKNSLINDRPVIIEDGATKETAIDAYSNKNLIKYPVPTVMNGTKYRFSIESADFDEENPKKGIYKIKVYPSTDDIFTNDIIEYAKQKNISFEKYYYYYERNKVFKSPTESNITSHNRINEKKLDEIAKNMTSSLYAFKPRIKNNYISKIIGVKSAKDIVKINNDNNGIFLPPIFYQNYSIEPVKKVVFIIEKITASDNDLDLLFSIKINVGNLSPFIVGKTSTKTIPVKNIL